MPLARETLSSYSQGALLPLATSGETLVHTATGPGTHFVQLTTYNRGAKERAIDVSINGATTYTVTLRVGRGPQVVVPGMPLYNVGAGVGVHLSLSHQAGAWTFPDNMGATIVLSDGAVTGVVTTGYSATPDAQPVLLVITDSDRGVGDLSHTKGTHAIVELSQVGSVLSAQVLRPGERFLSNNMSVNGTSGVLCTGYVMRDVV